jgi:hypothetical protein
VSSNFVPVKIHIKERLKDFGRFRAEWTPTVIITEPDGTERHRSVGYLPADDFLAELQLGLAKAAFSRGEYNKSQQAYDSIVQQHPRTETAPEALYWSAVSAYKATGNGEFLTQGGKQLQNKYPQSDWAKKGSVWVR